MRTLEVRYGLLGILSLLNSILQSYWASTVCVSWWWLHSYSDMKSLKSLDPWEIPAMQYLYHADKIEWLQTGANSCIFYFETYFSCWRHASQCHNYHLPDMVGFPGITIKLYTKVTLDNFMCRDNCLEVETWRASCDLQQQVLLLMNKD